MGSNPIARSILFQLLTVKAHQLFQLPHSLQHFEKCFSPDLHPWEWIPLIKTALSQFDFNAQVKFEDFPQNFHLENPDKIWIHPTAILPPYGYIKGPCYIGPHTELRPGVLIRGNVIVGAHCVLGNSCEYKNALLMDSVQTAHFNYVGDSILANKVHLGAGVILANVRLDKKEVVAQIENERFSTHLSKLGALVGESVEIGCNSVLQPGCIVGKNSCIGSLKVLKGFISPHSTLL